MNSLTRSDYRIRLNGDWDMDIPKGYHQLRQYCATLAHKANHSFTPNVEWGIFEHPRSVFCISLIWTSINWWRVISWCFGLESSKFDKGSTKMFSFSELGCQCCHHHPWSNYQFLFHSLTINEACIYQIFKVWAYSVTEGNKRYQERRWGKRKNMICGN